jgi:hypothetical protein
MILGDSTTENLSTMTLDDLFCRAATRRPNAVALADPPNRERFTDGPPRRLTYAETDRVVSAIACRLRGLGLPSGAIIGIQLANTVESVLTLLGVWRAGLIAALLPLLWRRADAANVLAKLGAKAIITTTRIGDFDACAMACEVAADIFSIRCICSFGRNCRDGVVAFDDLLDDAGFEPPQETVREGSGAAEVALVTFDVTPDGLVAVTRNHAELIAGGLAALVEGGIAPDARLLGCCATGSFAGLALTLLPWLLSGGTLLLHHGFDPDAFATQCRDGGCDTVVVPGALASQLVPAGLLAHAELKNVLAYWRAPERFVTSPAWQHPRASLTDMLIFGEIALIGSRRDTRGRPVPLPVHAVMAPRGSRSGVTVAEIARTGSGTIALRGPMVPRHAFPPFVETGVSPYPRADADGFVDTFYACRIDRMTGIAAVTGPPPGVVSVGGYRFVLSELEDAVRRANDGAFITALPDALAGHRLAGISSGTGELCAALARLGVNPLVADAFPAA